MGVYVAPCIRLETSNADKVKPALVHCPKTPVLSVIASRSLLSFDTFRVHLKGDPTGSWQNSVHIPCFKGRTPVSMLAPIPTKARSG